MIRSTVASLAALALLVPAAAQARISLRPRLAAAAVIESGPPKTGATAYGTEYSLGLAVGAPLFSVVGDLGFRKASVATADLEKGWTKYATDDTKLTVGVRSELTLLDLVRAAAELHLGESWADHQAAASGPVYRYGKPGEYGVFGGAVEGSYLLTRRISVGVRVGVDRFVPFGAAAAKGDYEFATDFERTSYTAGLLLGLGL
jgi:hypothetical protein